MDEKSLIEKFLRGKCSKQEAVKISRYLQKNPSALEHFLPEKEWKNYQQSSSLGNPDLELYKNIQNSIHQRSVSVKKIVYCTSAAAAIVCLFFGIHFFLQQKNMVVDKAIVAEQKKIYTYNNPSGKTKKFLLPDNTTVILFPDGEIKYTVDYNNLKRDVHLTGSAEFSVAKNKEKPFTVFCNSIATTALGTRFRVNGTGKNVSVALYEGKVVVRKIHDDKMIAYLQPGEQLAFNIDKNIFKKLAVKEHQAAMNTNEKTTHAVTVKLNNTTESQSSKKNVAHDIIEKAADVYMRFENKTLKTVLDRLAEKYQVEINYPTEISTSANIYISVDTTQGIEKILKNIAAANNLEFKKQSHKKYYISQ